MEKITSYDILKHQPTTDGETREEAFAAVSDRYFITITDTWDTHNYPPTHTGQTICKRLIQEQRHTRPVCIESRQEAIDALFAAGFAPVSESDADKNIFRLFALLFQYLETD